MNTYDKYNKDSNNKLTAMINVTVITAELDMTRALFGSRAMRDGIRDSARTSNLLPSRFDMYLHHTNNSPLMIYKILFSTKNTLTEQQMSN